MTEIPIQALPLKSVGLLRTLLKEIHIDAKKQPQDYFAIPHAMHIAQFAEEIVFLESHNYKLAAPVIARAIYESLFKLVLALEHPELAAEKCLREAEWSLIQAEFTGAIQRNLKDIRKSPEYTSIGELIVSLGQRWHLTSEQVASHNNYSTYWCAKKAGMVHIYQREYAELSSFAHASVDTFIDHALNATTSRVLVWVVFAINEAITRIAKKYRYGISDTLFNEVQQFDQLFRYYDKEGHIKRYHLKGISEPHSAKPEPPGKHWDGNWL